MQQAKKLFWINYIWLLWLSVTFCYHFTAWWLTDMLKNRNGKSIRLTSAAPHFRLCCNLLFTGCLINVTDNIFQRRTFQPRKNPVKHYDFMIIINMHFRCSMNVGKYAENKLLIVFCISYPDWCGYFLICFESLLSSFSFRQGSAGLRSARYTYCDGMTNLYVFFFFNAFSYPCWIHIYAGYIRKCSHLCFWFLVW